MVVVCKPRIKRSQNGSRVFCWIAVFEFESFFGVKTLLDKFSIVPRVLKIAWVGLHILLVVEGHVMVGHWMVQFCVANQIDAPAYSTTALVDVLPLSLLLK